VANPKEQTVTCRVPEATKRKIAKIAKEEQRSISNLAAILLESALQARQSKEQVTA
jgi:hypothetical protein